MKRLLTGLQPSGALHIGNYFGALKPFVETYGGYESFLMVADYHSLTSLKDPKALRENIVEIVRAYLAAGVDPSKAVIFKQSDVQEHTELAWIFECLVTVPFLELAHAYKDKTAKGLEANAGLFNYPMLMAADILLYDTEVVPVGRDQQQHVEYAREAANKFNLAYGQTFTEPQAKILESVATVPGTDGQKMSKSYKNTIPLFGSKEEISAAVMSIVTDSSGERPENVYQIHKLFKSEDELSSIYGTNKGNYKALKEALIEDIEATVGPMRQKYESISETEVKKVLAEGREKAHGIAAAKMADVRQKIGVSF
ncbi:MAG: tryptophan--tRNA ligase [Candidatus Adlerbacteria bacterium]|nr:tryptophan--tRNA ligase [Candidatus Adlerbacteria bacterium]MDZ4226166.1 tryptophan--tRNA ligase [Patescibacteria group bacterium]